MAEENVKRQRRRRRKRGGAYIAATVAVMAAAIAVAVGMFFLVSSVSVTGNEIYTAEQIAKASGVEKGKSIFLVNSVDVEDNIKSSFAYVDEVTVSRELPGSIFIEITESYPIALIRSGTSYWIIDKQGKLLEKTDSVPAAELVEVVNIKPLQPVEGSVMTVSVEEEKKLEYLVGFLEIIFEMDMHEDIEKLDMETATNMKFRYLERFDVELGRGENIADKLLLLKGVVKKLEPEETGKIDLSQIGKAHFLPD